MDEQEGLFDFDVDTAPEPPQEVLPVTVSRYVEAEDILVLPNEHLVIPDDTCDELALRALADILDHLEMPGNHGGMADLEVKVLRQGRVVYTREAFWVFDTECKVWIKLGDKLVANRIAAYRQTQYGKPTMEDKTVWEVNEDTGIKEPVVRQVKVYKRLRMTAAKNASALKMAQILVGRDAFFERAFVGLNFQDCLMLLDADHRWKMYHSERQNHRQRSIYPFSSPTFHYMDAPVTDERWEQVCPVLCRVLKSSLPNQHDDWRAIRMRFGLAMAGLSQHVRGAHLWFVGPKGSGKSSVATAFGALFPKEARTGVLIHKASEYKTGDLERSRINIVEECESIAQNSVDFFKSALTCGMHGTVECRDVGKPVVHANLKMFQIMCSNGQPEMPSKEVQIILDRFTLVHFQRFPGKADITIGRQMEEQARGLIEWSMAGFYDWQANGLIESKESALLKKSWWRSSDNILLWAASELRPEPEGAIPVHQPHLKTGAFEHYLKWCENSNILPRQRKTLQEFRKALNELELDVRVAGHHNVLSICGQRLKSQRADIPSRPV